MNPYGYGSFVPTRFNGFGLRGVSPSPVVQAAPLGGLALGQQARSSLQRFTHDDLDFAFDAAATLAGIMAAGSTPGLLSIVGYSVAVMGGVRAFSHVIDDTTTLMLIGAGGVVASFIHYITVHAEKRPRVPVPMRVRPA